MIFRPAVTEDLEALIAVQEEGAVEGLGHIFPQAEHPFPRAVVLQRWASELDDPSTQVYVCTDEAGTITGFAALRDDQLLHFGTALQTWGTGLAEELHDAVLACFPSTVARCRLRVFVENRRARRFYERLGWTSTGVATRSTFPPYAELVEYTRGRPVISGHISTVNTRPRAASPRFVRAEDEWRCSEAVAADAEAVATLVLAAFSARHGRAAPESTSTTEVAAWRDRLGATGQLCVVAKSPRGVDGVVRFVPSWFVHAADPDAQHAHMSVLATEPALWGSGLAQHLLAVGHTRVWERGFTAVELWTVVDNLRAQRFYERAGYVPTGAQESSRHGAQLIQFRRALGKGA